MRTLKVAPVAGGGHVTCKPRSRCIIASKESDSPPPEELPIPLDDAVAGPALAAGVLSPSVRWTRATQKKPIAVMSISVMLSKSSRKNSDFFIGASSAAGKTSRTLTAYSANGSSALPTT